MDSFAFDDRTLLAENEKRGNSLISAGGQIGNFAFITKK